MNKNKLIIAAAGSGKTTFLVNEALKQKSERVIITTFTQANELEIKNKIIELNKCVPNNITVQTWFSFLLKHGVRPFQGCLFEKKIKGLILVSGQSGFKANNKFNQPIYFGEEREFERHYFSHDLKIYSDKLAKFVFRCNEKSNGDVINRLSRIYPHIYIDEVQDLAGYDLNLLKLFFKCSSSTLLVGDPRQGTYSTNNSAKNNKFKKAEIVHFFEDSTIIIDRDETSLLVNFRCNAPICDISNKLFSNFPQTNSGNVEMTNHDGIFFINEKDINSYLKKYEPIQLRDSRKKEVNSSYRVMNFGESKGLSFDRVLIYPTEPFIKWLLNNDFKLAPTSRSKFYVALTRARYSIGIVHNFDVKKQVSGIKFYSDES